MLQNMNKAAPLFDFAEVSLIWKGSLSWNPWQTHGKQPQTDIAELWINQNSSVSQCSCDLEILLFLHFSVFNWEKINIQ